MSAFALRVLSVVLALAGMLGLSSPASGAEVWISDEGEIAVNTPLLASPWTDEPPSFQPASLIQPQPLLLPPSGEMSQAAILPPSARLLTGRFPGAESRASLGRQLAPSARLLLGAEASPRMASDAGSLIGKSPSGVGVSVQKRSPAVSEPRIRSNAVGSLAASGSYWVPARIDLDTVLSKMDSRLIDKITVIPGPYSSRLGPDYKFLDVRWLESPRFDGGFQSAGTTSIDYLANGQHVYGRQMLWAGNADWGLRASYGQRTVNDYRDGSGAAVPASFNSRDAEIAAGLDLDRDQRVEVHYLRLDQTVVELPGQAFDLNYLGTDALSLRHVAENLPGYDRLELAAWFNRTGLAGDNSRPGKPAQFPAMDLFDLQARTRADVQSAGFQAAITFGQDDCPQLILGTDLRFVSQKLDEFADAEIGDTVLTNINSPIPPSTWLDPGVFVEAIQPVNDCLTLRCGGRLDFVTTEITEIPPQVTSRELTLPQLFGTDDFDQQFLVWSLFAGANWEVTENWSVSAEIGRGSRPPNLTELYAAEPFMLLLQNGQNVITGNPLLNAERVWQADLGVQFETPDTRLSLNVFHAQLFDYVTFQNLGVVRVQGGAIVQESLQYVNTDRATKSGFELLAARNVAPWCVAFGTAGYVIGTDQTRNGDSATDVRLSGNFVVSGLPRGFFSGIAGADQEPLPMIFPLDSRLGLRFQQPLESKEAPAWSIEISARIVAAQARVATSLVETPTPGFTVWDVRAYWQASDRLLLLAGIENFGDRTYREHLDFRSATGAQLFQPGANAYVGTQWSF